jgi:hypothetical protein
MDGCCDPMNLDTRLFAKSSGVSAKQTLSKLMAVVVSCRRVIACRGGENMLVSMHVKLPTSQQ